MPVWRAVDAHDGAANGCPFIPGTWPLVASNTAPELVTEKGPSRTGCRDGNDRRTAGRTGGVDV